MNGKSNEIECIKFLCIYCLLLLLLLLFFSLLICFFWVVLLLFVNSIKLNNQSIMPSSGVIQLTLTLKMTTAQVVERQSLSTTTVLFRTTFTRTIKLNLLLKTSLISTTAEMGYFHTQPTKSLTVFFRSPRYFVNLQ